MKPAYVFGLCLLALVVCNRRPVGGAEESGQDDIRAIRFLADVDSYYYPETQTVLMDSLKNDPREPVRYEAVMALTKQLQRGKPPLNPLLGWRKVPDPNIIVQIARLSKFQEPLTTAELIQRYSDQKVARDLKKGKRRGDIVRNYCNEDVIAALSHAAHGKDEVDCFYEPSERIRTAAGKALLLCID